METHLENVPDHVDPVKIRQALRSYARRLRLPTRLAVTVRWCSGWPRTDLAELSSHGLEWFIICMNADRKGTAIYQTLAHEMVHIRQWVRGDLREGPPGQVYWKRRIHKWDTETLAYWDAPWEVEARGMEMALYVRFKQERGYRWTDLKARA
jgi:hypothetical protein